MADFPTPDELRAAYEDAVGIDLTAPLAKPLVTPYRGGEGARYYQDAAIRAVFEKLARGGKRALLSLATGSGKTFIAVNLLRRIADVGQLNRALFLCDREELRNQGLAAFQNAFGSDAAAVSGSSPQKNARVPIATYQTLDVDTDDANADFLETNYPPDYFRLDRHRDCSRDSTRAPYASSGDARYVAGHRLRAYCSSRSTTPSLRSSSIFSAAGSWGYFSRTGWARPILAGPTQRGSA
jgi:type I restriction enzyme R subunit